MKTIRKSKSYPQEDDTPSFVNEAAAQYRQLSVILGDNNVAKKSRSGDFGLIALSREGVRISSLKALANSLGVTLEVMSSLLHTSYRNIQRKDQNDLLDSLRSEKVLELATFVQRGIEVIGGGEAFKEWLHSPLMSLGDKSPLDFLDTSFGIQMVSKILGRIEHGVYS